MSLSPETNKQELARCPPSTSPNTAPVVYTLTETSSEDADSGRRGCVLGGPYALAVVTDVLNTRHVVVSEAGESMKFSGRVVDFSARPMRNRKKSKCQGRFYFGSNVCSFTRDSRVPHRFRRILARKIQRHKAEGWQVAYGDTRTKEVACAACGSAACKSVGRKPSAAIRKAWEWGIVGNAGDVVMRWACQRHEEDRLQEFVESAVSDAESGQCTDFKKLYRLDPKAVKVRLLEIQEGDEIGSDD